MAIRQILLRWTQLSQIQKWSFYASVGCYLIGYILLGYMESFEFLRGHGVSLSLILVTGWLFMLLVLKGCNWVECKVNEGVTLLGRIGFLILQLFLMVVFNVAATISSSYIKGELGIWMCSFMLASISFLEIMLMEDKDYGLAEMVHAILLGATSTMVNTHLVLYPISALCCIRKVAVFTLREYTSDAEVQRSRTFITFTKRNADSLKIQWERTEQALACDRNNPIFAEFYKLGNDIERFRSKVRNVPNGDE